MKKLLLSSAVLLATTALVSAADLPRRTVAPAPVMAVPVFTWTGFYAGLHGGYIGHDSDATLRGVGGATLAAPVAFATTGIGSGFGLDSDGFMFGGQIGGNVQFGMFVAGLEADISYTDVGARAVFLGRGQTTTYRTDMDYFGTVRGRLGLAFDRVMIYGTGGLAYAGLDNRVVSTTALLGGQNYSGRSDDSEIGYTVGAGIEYALTNNLTIKGEYLYYDFDRRTVRAQAASGVAADFIDVRFRDDGHIGRVGVNFKF
jgi:outer membrane immunogenic protein